ncbi:hypothetical protein CONPUDRAFT_92847 [Coniophora puteana RWD-64-598 SS2]|uniref:Mediator of RNA polymerase II transcription subunit 20 n=1 Tax=Coniophora puteana (strain RWD-64-598) TaxID=741705 RepID=A0A5M3MAI9_CONPW|nr:uncharacterized protein CONPUDRAFT_92847 [Coniophora puteana RWD-64-598 SS2]EIW76127.1 hypothetical protein CONPUDRAFT_92847 [Coniophora puteana RWD-64-598 SS2]
MGFTGLARWINAPTTGLELIRENIVRNHQGQIRGRWSLSIRSYRSTLGLIPGIHLQSERSMHALTMNDNVFVVLDDPAAPNRSEFLGAVQSGQQLQTPPHFRTTFLTLSPPGGLEQLLAQLRARWVPVRQTSTNAQRGQGSGQQLMIEGFVAAIGTDWVVRVGNVILSGGAIKGMLLEAEYLPLPCLRPQTADHTSELLANLLTAVLPNLQDAKTVAISISDQQWAEVLWDREEEEQHDSPAKNEEDIFAYGDEDLTVQQKGDWVGTDRDRRSAYLIIGALKSEGIL